MIVNKENMTCLVLGALFPLFIGVLPVNVATWVMGTVSFLVFFWILGQIGRFINDSI